MWEGKGKSWRGEGEEEEIHIVQHNSSVCDEYCDGKRRSYQWQRRRGPWFCWGTRRPCPPALVYVEGQERTEEEQRVRERGRKSDHFI